MHRFKRATGPIAPISILRGVDARIRVAAGRYIPLYDPKRLSRLNAVVYSATSIIPGDTSGQLSTLLAVVTVAIWTR